MCPPATPSKKAPTNPNQTPETIQAKPDDCKIQTTPSSIVEPGKTSPSKSEKSSLKPEIKISSLEEEQSDSKSETNLVTPSKSSPQPTPSKSPAKAGKASPGKTSPGKASPGKASPGKASPGKASPKRPEEPEEEARFDPKGKSITTNRTATGWL